MPKAAYMLIWLPAESRNENPFGVTIKRRGRNLKQIVVSEGGTRRQEGCYGQSVKSPG